MWKILKTKAWLIAAKLLKKYRNQVWAHRKQIKSIAEKQYYAWLYVLACRETQLRVATVNL